MFEKTTGGSPRPVEGTVIRIFKENDMVMEAAMQRQMEGAQQTYEAMCEEIVQLTAQRDQAVQMLADWCDAVRDNGSGWDDWDEYYKDAAWRPCLIRELIDAARTPEAV